MKTKVLSLLAGAVLLGGVSVANAAEPLTPAQMDAVSAGVNVAFASADALALGPNTATATSASTVAVYKVGSASSSKSAAIAF